MKITLNADHLWLVRSTRTAPADAPVVRYYESPAVWNKSPAHATIFQDFDMASAHIAMLQRDAAGTAWADGTSEVLDVVTMWGALMTSPHGDRIQVRRA